MGLADGGLARSANGAPLSGGSRVRSGFACGCLGVFRGALFVVRGCWSQWSSYLDASFAIVGPFAYGHAYGRGGELRESSTAMIITFCCAFLLWRSAVSLRRLHIVAPLSASRVVACISELWARAFFFGGVAFGWMVGLGQLPWSSFRATRMEFLRSCRGKRLVCTGPVGVCRVVRLLVLSRG
eukprot:4733678-Pyramimonas_sp.AAC.1